MHIQQGTKCRSNVSNQSTVTSTVMIAFNSITFGPHTVNREIVKNVQGPNEKHCETADTRDIANFTRLPHPGCLLLVFV